ncbi:hypothetical protein [Mycobacterium sp. E740]|uniref:hypothetical protein n=1 Tax=Mycobacterium sp. E740 TaxID=1834149 RepID=UPI0012EAB592|nr:hypothetical protein [Mycobacterium sp. E740]
MTAWQISRLGCCKCMQSPDDGNGPLTVRSPRVSTDRRQRNWVIAEKLLFYLNRLHAEFLREGNANISSLLGGKLFSSAISAASNPSGNPAFNRDQVVPHPGGCVLI